VGCSIKILEPPLGHYSDKIYHLYVCDDSTVVSLATILALVRDGFLTDFWDRVLKGELAKWTLDRFFVGETNGKVVANVVYSVPRDTRDVGVLSMVFTKPEHRRKGIASILVEAALRTFEKDGGLAMHLGTANPVAIKMYKKFGFRPYFGNGIEYVGMRYVTAGEENFANTYLALAGKAVVREAHWGDWPRLVFLYNSPRPDWLIKDCAQRVFRDFGVDFAKKIADAEKGRGALLVLENPKKRVVGASSLTELGSSYERHAKIMDFHIFPDYFNQADDLLKATIKKAGDTDTEIIEMCVAECDEEKKELAERVGFTKEAVVRGHLVESRGRVDLEFYMLHL